MSKKKELCYDAVFKTILKLCPTLKPEKIITDFEIALRNSLRKHFPTTKIIGCWFHFTQVIIILFIYFLSADVNECLYYELKIKYLLTRPRLPL